MKYYYINDKMWEASKGKGEKMLEIIRLRLWPFTIKTEAQIIIMKKVEVNFKALCENLDYQKWPVLLNDFIKVSITTSLLYLAWNISFY
jgi:hypothetical protein